MLTFFYILIIFAWIGLLCWIIWCAAEASAENRPREAWALVIVFVLMIAVPLTIGINQSQADNAKPFDGYVYKKSFYPEHTSYVLSGKVMVPVHYPARWNFVLKNETDQRSCDIEESVFYSVQMGDEYHCGGF